MTVGSFAVGASILQTSIVSNSVQVLANIGNVTYTQFQSAPLVERRVSATDRYGLGSYTTYGTRVYCGATHGRTCMSVALGDGPTDFIDGIVVIRNSTTLTANVGINNTNPGAALDVLGNMRVDGTIYSTGDITAFSDVRMKSNLQPITDALEKSCMLTGYTFDKPFDTAHKGRRHVGLVAQEVEAILPEAVYTVDEYGTKSIAYGNMLGLTINAIKELNQKLDCLQRQVQVLSKAASVAVTGAVTEEVTGVVAADVAAVP